MQTLLRKYSFPLSIVLFLIASILFANQVLAIGKPAGVGGNPGYNAQSNPGSGNIPSQATQATAGNTQGGVQPSGASIQGQTGTSRIPAFAQVHLQDAKLKACQAISSSLITRSTHIVDLVNQQEKTFTGIAGGVEQYYLTKVVPTGTTLPNYDVLVADITTKQAAIATPLQAAQNDVTNFSCTGNNPAANLTQFRTDMQAVLQALQVYRTSIKNLIVAVRTLPSVQESPTPSPTTTPAVSPSVIPSAGQ